MRMASTFAVPVHRLALVMTLLWISLSRRLGGRRHGYWGCLGEQICDIVQFEPSCLASEACNAPPRVSVVRNEGK